MGKTIPRYGVWSATPISFQRIDARNPHIHLQFVNNLGDGQQFETAINVKSQDRDSRLVFWLVENLQHDFTSQLLELTPGYNGIKHGNPLGLDFVRSGIIDLTAGELLEYDAANPDNDIEDRLTPFLQAGVDKQAKVFIFGSEYDGHDGIHDVHMNQGSLPRFENGVGQDGAIMLYFKDDDRWDALFIAFASQKIPTDDRTGIALPGAVELVDQLTQQSG